MSLSYEAMLFARTAHKNQCRKYTNSPYFDHLAEVVGIVSSVAHDDEKERDHLDLKLAVSWLHDYIEDINPREDGAWGWHELDVRFGKDVADGVRLLSDLEIGNRAERKAASRIRLANAPGWIQTIKCADLISNASSIVDHDPKFAVTFLREKCLLLAALTKADPRLVALAKSQILKDDIHPLWK